MIVVSNTSPINNLAKIGQLDLLRQIYGQIIIPQAVYDEIVLGGGGQAGAAEVQAGLWILTRQVADRAQVAKLQGDLDIGEAEALALALELSADLLLLDERRGSTIATRLGQRNAGLLNVLLVAKRQGLVPAVKPLLDDLIQNARFWIGKPLYIRILQAAGE